MGLLMASIIVRGSIYDWYAMPFIAGAVIVPRDLYCEKNAAPYA